MLYISHLLGWSTTLEASTGGCFPARRPGGELVQGVEEHLLGHLRVRLPGGVVLEVQLLECPVLRAAQVPEARQLADLGGRTAGQLGGLVGAVGGDALGPDVLLVLSPRPGGCFFT